MNKHINMHVTNISKRSHELWTITLDSDGFGAKLELTVTTESLPSYLPDSKHIIEIKPAAQ